MPNSMGVAHGWYKVAPFGLHQRSIFNSSSGSRFGPVKLSRFPGGDSESGENQLELDSGRWTLRLPPLL